MTQDIFASYEEQVELIANTDFLPFGDKGALNAKEEIFYITGVKTRPAAKGGVDVLYDIRLVNPTISYKVKSKNDKWVNATEFVDSLTISLELNPMRTAQMEALADWLEEQEEGSMYGPLRLETYGKRFLIVKHNEE